MKTIHRFIFPTESTQAIREIPKDFDLHVNIGDWVEFDSSPGNFYVVTRKIFKVKGFNTVERVDYDTAPVTKPLLS